MKGVSLRVDGSVRSARLVPASLGLNAMKCPYSEFSRDQKGVTLKHHVKSTCLGVVRQGGQFKRE